MSPIIYIGNGCIALAVGLALFGILLFVVGTKTNGATAMALGRAALYGNFILLTIANLAMVYALLHNDFGVSYVAHVGSTSTPRWVAGISLWSSLEGSILFWGWILTAYAAICTYIYRTSPSRLMPWVGITLLIIELFFFILLAFPANPFLPMSPVPMDGPGPNPLLQNHWLMTIHPPFLYLGYIGFTVPFAFAIAALIEKDLPGAWVTMTRRWTLFAWSFLSMAIVLGGWWSYAVLGWGGYWAWDPVENASFMPWLTATALVHSVIVQEKRRMLPVWNLTLAIITFLLTLLGTFLTRSGVLESVHSFTESGIGPIFLTFIGIVLAISLGLLLWRGSAFRDPGRVENMVSLEVLFLFNNLLFVSFCFIVFLGTFYPLIVEALRGTRVSVGEPYFNQMAVPIVAMILLVMNIGVVVPWRQGNVHSILRMLRLPAIIGIAVTIVACLVGRSHAGVLLMLFLAVTASIVMVREMARHGWRFFHVLSLNPRRYGGFISHIGALMIVVAVAFSSVYEQEKEVTLTKGTSTTMGKYTLTFAGVQTNDVPQRFEVKAIVTIVKGQTNLGELTPQMNYYPNSREPIASPAIRSNLIEDLYLTVINVAEDGSEVSLRVIVAPAVAWIWIGGIVVMLGGILALALREPLRANPERVTNSIVTREEFRADRLVQEKNI